MSIYIHNIETLVPPFAYKQDYSRDRMIHWLPGKRNQRLLTGIYDQSSIHTRYSVLPDFIPEETPILFREDENGKIIEPSTGERNRVFREHARPMYIEAARKVIEKTPGFTKEDVTHVVTVSCTGFYNPGPDYDVVQGLELPDSTERYNIGFMGCYAAFPGLRMAHQFCQANPNAVVLVICLELCTLHVQFREETDSMLANALFADGAAAVIVSGRKPQRGPAALKVASFHSALAPEGVGDMAWEIGDHGFDIRLSTYIPKIIGGSIHQIVDHVLKDSSVDIGQVKNWAIHPGGRAILDRIESELSLREEQIGDSRSVLGDYGNMSSATVLFVLKRILERKDDAHHVCAMAFGPGLTIDSGLFEYQPA